MKKVFTLLLTAAMVFSLAACGSASGTPEPAGDPSRAASGGAPTEPATNPEGVEPAGDLSNAPTDSVAVPEGTEPAGEPPDAENGNPPAAPAANPDSSVPASSQTPADTSANHAEPTDAGSKVLIAYFSATGTTKKIAEYAADAASADLYEIVPAEPYTDDDLNYNVSDCRANTEMNDSSSRPEISGSAANMADYDIVFIGYPIWWGEAPRIISTFMESYDFSSKTVVTFSTSGGSGHNDRSIKELAGGANWVTGTRLKSNSAQSDVAQWINGLGLDIAVK